MQEPQVFDDIRPTNRTAGSRVRALVVLAAGVAVGMAAPGQAGAQGSDDDIDEVGPGILGSSATPGSLLDSGSSTTQLRDPARRASVLETQLRAHFGDRFGGTFDRPDADRYTLVVAATALTEEDHSVVEGLGRPVELVEVDHAMSTLERWRDEIDALLTDQPADSIWALNPTRNVVEVYIDDLDRLPPASAGRLRELAELEGVVLREGLEMSPSAGDYPAPHWSGVGIGVGSGYSTSGFTINTGFGLMGTTAGHCGAVGSKVWEASGEGGTLAVSGVQVDEIRMREYGGGHDFATFLDPAGQGRVRISDSSWLDVKGTQDPNWLEQGYCMRGARLAGETCGGVSLVGNFTSSGQTVSGFCVGSNATGPGDSGSGWYRRTGGNDVLAVGIHSGSVPSQGWSCADRITDVLAASGSTIATYTPPAK